MSIIHSRKYLVSGVRIKNGEPMIPQLPALPEDERGPPLWTPDMKGTAEGNLMEWVLAMQLEKRKLKEVDWSHRLGNYEDSGPSKFGGMGMSSCKVCHLDVKKHSKKLWALHQQAQICTFCQKNASEHSTKLWQMHKLAVEKGQFCPFHKKNEKLYPITIGSARASLARVCKLNADPPYDIDFVPIHMLCSNPELQSLPR